MDGYTSLHRAKGVGDTYQELGGEGEWKFIKVRAGKELLKGHQCNFRTPIKITCIIILGLLIFYVCTCVCTYILFGGY